MAGTPFAAAADVTTAWRPLSTEESTRADYWLGVASRRIRRRWTDVDDRVALADSDPRHIAPEDLKDVVVTLVIDVLGGPSVPYARSESVSSGTESRSVQLSRAGRVELPPFADWMVEIFQGPATGPVPIYGMPASIGYDPIFVTQEQT